MIKILKENNEIKQTLSKCICEVRLQDWEEAQGLKHTDLNEVFSNVGGDVECYWICTNHRAGDGYACADCVDRHGRILEKYPYLSNVGVRPVLKLENAKQAGFYRGDKFEFGGYTFKIFETTLMGNDYAICDKVIGTCPYIRDDEADLAAQNAGEVGFGRFSFHDEYYDIMYNKSDVKKYLDNWFLESKKDLECKELELPTDDELFDVAGMTGW